MKIILIGIPLPKANPISTFENAGTDDSISMDAHPFSSKRQKTGLEKFQTKVFKATKLTKEKLATFKEMRENRK